MGDYQRPQLGKGHGANQELGLDQEEPQQVSPAGWEMCISGTWNT